MSRARVVAPVLSAAGGACALLSASQSWAQVRSAAGAAMPSIVSTVEGGALAPGVVAGGLVLLAGAGALLAAGRGAARVIGVLLVCAGVAVAFTAAAGGAPAAVLAHVIAGTGAAATVEVTRTPAWLLAVVGGVAGVAGGATAVTGARSWAGLADRYRRVAGADRAEDPTQLWDALDQGRDLTAEQVRESGHDR